MHRSSVYDVNESGPSTEPWRTPRLTYYMDPYDPMAGSSLPNGLL